MEVPAIAAGTLAAIHVQAGEGAPVGAGVGAQPDAPGNAYQGATLADALEATRIGNALRQSLASGQAVTL